MRIIRQSTEAEVVAVFLRAELDSPRYGERIRELLPDAGLDESALLAPELEDADANARRARASSRSIELGSVATASSAGSRRTWTGRSSG